MILRILVGAVVGAVFGYIVGWIVEMFPNFNAALLSGIAALTGISGVRIPALLAAIGFILGILGGLLHGLTYRRGHRYRY
jgi:MFS family permease